MYSDDIPFGVTRFDSIQRDSQWRHRIDKEEGNANKSKRLYRNPITGQGFAKTRMPKPRTREENRVLTNNYGDKNKNNVNYNESKSNDNEEVKVGSSYGNNTSRSINSVKSMKNNNNNNNNNVGGMVPKIPIQQLTRENLRKQLTNQQRNRLKNHRLAKSIKSNNSKKNNTTRSNVSAARKSTSRSKKSNNNNLTNRSGVVASSRIASSRIASSRASSGISSYRSGNTDAILDRILRLEQVLEEESEKRRKAEQELDMIKQNVLGE